MKTMEALLERCCGIDLHKDSIVACMLIGAAEGTPEVVMRSFGTQYDDLSEPAVWMDEHGCAHLAMESTGGYWMPLYNRLTELGATCIVVNAGRIKNVPGRKTDRNDAQWIAHLYRHGLLQASYVPERDQQILRSHTRALETLTQDRTREKNRVEKLLQTEGFKFSSVLEDIFCATGRRLLDVLVRKGKVSPADVERCRDPQCKRSAKEIAAALRGRMSPAISKLLAFKLRQIDGYNAQIAELEQLIEEVLTPYGSAVDLIDSIPGIARHAAVQVIAEIGADMSNFHSSEQLASWAGLSPRNAQSAGKKVYPDHARQQPSQTHPQPMCMELFASPQRTTITKLVLVGSKAHG